MQRLYFAGSNARCKGSRLTLRFPEFCGKACGKERLSIRTSLYFSNLHGLHILRCRVKRFANQILTRQTLDKIWISLPLFTHDESNRFCTLITDYFAGSGKK